VTFIKKQKLYIIHFNYIILVLFFLSLSLSAFFFSIALVLMLVRHNLDDLCWDVMNMKPHNDERSSLASKSEASSRVGLKYALEN